jgi:hypothetical protein
MSEYSRTPEEIVDDIYGYADDVYFKECCSRLHRQESAIRLSEAITINGDILFPANTLLEISFHI